MKTCTKCGEQKPLDGFYTQNGKPLAKCKLCVSAYQRARYAQRLHGPRQMLETTVLGSWPLRTSKACSAPSCKQSATRALLLKETGSEPVLTALCDPHNSVAMVACGV